MLFFNKKSLLIIAITTISTVVLSTKAVAMYQATYTQHGQNPNKTSSKIGMNHQNLAYISPVQFTKKPPFSFFNTKNTTSSPTPTNTNSSTSGTAPTTPTPVLAAGTTVSTPTPTSNPLPPQGVYENCSPLGANNSCLSELDTIAAGGFTRIVNYDEMYGDAVGTTAYLNRANADGIQIIFAMNNPVFWDGTTNLRTYFPALAATCNCSDNNGFIQYIVNLVKNNSALWGYYIGDELTTSVHAQWKTYADLIHQTDATHPRLIVEGTKSNSYVNTDLTTFADGVDAMGQDYYPIGNSNIVPYSQTGIIAQGLTAIAHQYQKQFGMVLQVFSMQQIYPPACCSPYPDCATYPTVDQMTQMRNLVLQNSNPNFILWYSYQNILSSDNPTLRWNNLVSAAFAPYP